MRTRVRMCEQTTGAEHWRHDVGAPVFADAQVLTSADESQLLLLIVGVDSGWLSLCRSSCCRRSHFCRRRTCDLQVGRVSYSMCTAGHVVSVGRFNYN